MINLVRAFKRLIYFGLISGAFTLSSCEKMSGTSLIPPANAGSTASTNGVGLIAAGATNTVIFQVYGSNKYTWTTPTYLGGYVSIFGINSVSSANSTATDAFNITFSGTTTGTYDALSTSIISPALNLVDQQKMKVNVTKLPTGLGSLTGIPTGTFTGTFDGYMLDQSKTPAVSVRVYGSFNITM